jgi:phospholipase C
MNTTDPLAAKIFVDKTSPNLSPCDPDHSTPGTTAKLFGKLAAHSGILNNASMSGFVENEAAHVDKDYCGVMSMFTPERVPVITALAEEFAIMDRFFCSHPGPTWPNRMFTLSATSAGSTETGTWYSNTPGTLFPQKTIFDQVAAANLTWRNYYNDTPWVRLPLLA